MYVLGGAVGVQVTVSVCVGVHVDLILRPADSFLWDSLRRVNDVYSNSRSFTDILTNTAWLCKETLVSRRHICRAWKYVCHQVFQSELQCRSKSSPGSAVSPDTLISLTTVTYCSGSTWEELNLSDKVWEYKHHTSCCSVFSGHKRPNIRVEPKPDSPSEITTRIRLHVEKWRKSRIGTTDEK